MKKIASNLVLELALIFALSTLFNACTLSAETITVKDAKAALFEVIDTYEPGAPVSEELTARIDAAAKVLEQAAGQPPELAKMTNMLTGQWASLFSSQGIVGEIDMAFMTRAHPGGGVAGGKATSHMVLQELNPEKRFYRNMMVMSAGENDTQLLHIATADLGLAEDQPNVLEVSFRRIEFVPANAQVNLAQLRAVLDLPEDAHLAIDIPQIPDRPASRSTVSYLDEDLRINRGKSYIAILQKVQ